jgi:exodeoxyribonuclease VII small subunit
MEQAPKYNEIVQGLESVVLELEGGKLSLEDSLERFSQGVKLVERGEELLREAEKRIDLLLHKDGTTAPLPVDPSAEGRVAPARPVAAAAPARKAKSPAAVLGDSEGDDVPF